MWWTRCAASFQDTAFENKHQPRAVTFSWLGGCIPYWPG